MKWTDKELDFLEKNYKIMTRKELSIFLNKSENSIRGKFQNLTLKKKPHWNEEEINFLKINYLYKLNKELALLLNKSLGSIRSKLDRLDLKRTFLSEERKKTIHNIYSKPHNKKRVYSSEEIKKNMSKNFGLYSEKGNTLGFLKGKKNPNFNNWSSREPYGKDFSPELKEGIRKRDCYKCQECFISQDELGYKLHVHHIDFDKRHNSYNNLISLCKNCHSQTNFNRVDWIKYFKEKIFPPSFNSGRRG